MLISVMKQTHPVSLHLYRPSFGTEALTIKQHMQGGMNIFSSNNNKKIPSTVEQENQFLMKISSINVLMDLNHKHREDKTWFPCLQD